MESASSAAKGTSSRREIPPFPSRVQVVDSETAFDDSKTKVGWPVPEFGKRTDIKNVNGKTCKGTVVAAGTTFPLGAAMPCMTVLQYGCYFPAGTMFPQGCLVPIHQRLVSVVPIPTEETHEGHPEEVWCTIQ